MNLFKKIVAKIGEYRDTPHINPVPTAPDVETELQRAEFDQQVMLDQVGLKTKKE